MITRIYSSNKTIVAQYANVMNRIAQRGGILVQDFASITATKPSEFAGSCAIIAIIAWIFFQLPRLS